LSSTSKNVREIWNGNRVVRQTGESKTTEIVYDSAWADTPLSNSKPTEGEFLRPVVSFKDAVGYGADWTNKEYEIVSRLSRPILWRLLYILGPGIPIARTHMNFGRMRGKRELLI